ncbi:MAG: CapA family protein, partial [Candidatus Tectomicrobia bacterium]|nr:CapA family protein [Candidatus Tectomicrobia bacterium]
MIVKPSLGLVAILKLSISLYLLVCLHPVRAYLAQEFMVGDYRAYAIMGEAKLAPGVDYISFTGDYGFSGWLPPKEWIESHVAHEFRLLSKFWLSVINLEFLLPGVSGRALDRRIDSLMIDALKSAGYDLVSLANNHAMDFGAAGVHYNSTQL